MHVFYVLLVCINGWLFVYELSDCGFEFCCSHLKKSTFIKNKKLIKNNILNGSFKINKIINKFSLTTDEFMPELHFKQPRFS